MGVLPLVLLTALAGCTALAPGAPATVRLGWQVPWATQGQITQVLKHTSLLQQHGLQAEFTGFSYGGPLNEAARAGSVDVIFTADQPAATLLAAGAPWKIVARLMYNRVALYVPPDSPVRSVADLRGKKVAMPFGAAAQRDALEALARAGLDPRRDVESVNLDIYEQTNVVQGGTRSSWGEIDAMAGFDPTPAQLEHAGVARMLHVGRVVSVVVMADDFLRRQPQAARSFLRALRDAYYYYATHQADADRWFLEESRLTFDPAVLSIAASVEPNLRATRLEEIDIMLRDHDLQQIQSAADFIFAQGLARAAVQIREHVDLSPLQGALSASGG